MEVSPKWLVLYGAVSFASTLGYAVFYGRKYAKTKDTLDLEHHQSGLVGSMWTLALTVVLILMVRQLVGPIARPDMLWVHLPLVLTAVGIAAAMMIRFDGLRAPHLHWMLAYASIGCFGLGLGTGLYMLYRM